MGPRWRARSAPPDLAEGVAALGRSAGHALSAPSCRTPTRRRHRPLADYMEGAIRAGFSLRGFQEPMATAADLQASARFLPMTRVPYFLFMRWQKS